MKKKKTLSSCLKFQWIFVVFSTKINTTKNFWIWNTAIMFHFQWSILEKRSVRVNTSVFVWMCVCECMCKDTFTFPVSGTKQLKLLSKWIYDQNKFFIISQSVGNFFHSERNNIHENATNWNSWQMISDLKNNFCRQIEVFGSIKMALRQFSEAILHKWFYKIKFYLCIKYT